MSTPLSPNEEGHGYFEDEVCFLLCFEHFLDLCNLHYDVNILQLQLIAKNVGTATDYIT